MGGGQFGTAVSTAITAHHSGRPVHVLVAEGRPLLDGARVAAWELAQAGVPYALVTDAGAPACIADGEVGAVLVTAERICANGDIVGMAGTYPLALAADAAGVPFLVLAATTAVDLATTTGDDALIEEGRPGDVTVAAGARVVAERTPVRNPRLDVTPARLVTTFVTEEGVIGGTAGRVVDGGALADALAAHVHAADARRASAPGFAALVAQRHAAAGS
jgi:eIF-2B alpha/beta/delta-like uncharacterized protein